MTPYKLRHQTCSLILVGFSSAGASYGHAVGNELMLGCPLQVWCRRFLAQRPHNAPRRLVHEMSEWAKRFPRGSCCTARSPGNPGEVAAWVGHSAGKEYAVTER